MKDYSALLTFLKSICFVAVMLINYEVACAAINDRVTATVHDAGTASSETFQLDIDEAEVPMKWPNAPPGFDGLANVDTVHITCTTGCSPGVSYTEKSDYIVISASRFSDNSPDLVTLWGTGDGYVIKIDRVGGGSITKALDECTRTWPQIKADRHGALALFLTPCVDANYPTFHIFQLWHWNGTRFYVAGNYKAMLF
jgi:hypothetical protein